MHVDYLIVGAGLTGAVVARMLADHNRDVLVVDRRAHVGGNVHDHLHSSGVRIHTYGPHYFRTSSERIWEWATRFDRFYKYEAEVLSLVDGELAIWPVTSAYIQRIAGEQWAPEFSGEPANLEEAALSIMPRAIYERFVKEYNAKQWGVPCTLLDAGLCRRFDVRQNNERRLTPLARYQGLPVHGYAAWTTAMLAGIPTLVNYDYLRRADEITVGKHLLFTGPIDEYFGYSLGKLLYRGQKRHHAYHPEAKFMLPTGQVNNPQHAGGAHIRTLEWKRMMEPRLRDQVVGTVVTTETPCTPVDPGKYEYPFPDRANAALYQRYRQLSLGLESVTIAGRLGEYRYYDMDQAIGRAMVIAERLLGG